MLFLGRRLWQDGGERQRTMLGWFLPSVFLGPAQRRLSARGVPIFCFHKIADPPRGTADPFLYVRPGRFAAQLAALRRWGFGAASVAEARAARDNRERRVVLAFDDGYVNVLENGLERLAQHGHKAIQFLVAGRLGGRNEWDIAKGDVPEALMDAGQVRDWLGAGQEIGSHSMSHRDLRRLSAAEAREEIGASKRALEDRFGLAVRHFCYPYGVWNEAVRDLVGEAGYETACTLVFGVNRAATPPLELRRIMPLSGSELLAKAWHRAARAARRGKRPGRGG
jgi:peptidoglycan/xylan/chitin deacetylase (PgdA/CDA1 family)